MSVMKSRSDRGGLTRACTRIAGVPGVAGVLSDDDIPAFVMSDSTFASVVVIVC